MEGTYKAVLSRAEDYRDNDKLLRLITLEAGVVSAVIKGVKKQGAKLKFGAMPFAFCEYDLVKKGNYYVVTGCSIIEDIFGLSSDYEKFLYAGVITETAEYAIGSEANAELFVLMLKCLKRILYSDISPALAALYFCQQAIHKSGYGYDYGAVPEEIKNTMGLLAYINVGDIDFLEEPKGAEDLILPALKKIISNFEKKFGCTINASKLI